MPLQQQLLVHIQKDVGTVNGHARTNFAIVVVYGSCPLQVNGAESVIALQL